MDEIRRREMRSAHTKHWDTCECGRIVSGNGRVGHFRACRAYLAKYGWPYNEGDDVALRAVAREATGHLPADERSAGFLAFIREARIGEARRRGLIP